MSKIVCLEGSGGLELSELSAILEIFDELCEFCASFPSRRAFFAIPHGTVAPKSGKNCKKCVPDEPKNRQKSMIFVIPE